MTFKGLFQLKLFYDSKTNAQIHALSLRSHEVYNTYVYSCGMKYTFPCRNTSVNLAAKGGKSLLLIVRLLYHIFKITVQAALRISNKINPVTYVPCLFAGKEGPVFLWDTEVAVGGDFAQSQELCQPEDTDTTQ